MSEQQSIKNSLDVIRKALEDDNSLNINEHNDNVLILNRLVKNDGTIDVIDDENLNKSDVSKILNDKLDEVFELYFTKWLDKNLPSRIEKYLKNKKI
tara:strand:- start:1215 stop:1505 length:291 start_codon:yes stop_codon:yes gene_type:complete